ncbi:MAG TPA: alpha-amylase family glycosyl hydrolase [Ignavibacteriaceae bacterium]|nr:alpha-amylase family glycosyl hydrolase [Ignavibacteriaceae bacterium]
MLRFEFQILKEARIKYEIATSLFSLNGDIIIGNFRLARDLAQKINSKRRSESSPDKIVTPGQINATGLLHEISHFIIREYEKENSGVFKRAINYLADKTGTTYFENVLVQFVADFPPPQIAEKKKSIVEYLNDTTGGKDNREIVLEELILLNISNSNPATEALNEIYSDEGLKNKTQYKKLLDETGSFFQKEKPFGSENLPLTQFLMMPIISNPNNLDDQLNYIQKHWGIYIYEKFGNRLLLSKDLFAEDAGIFKIGGFQKSTPPVPEYDIDFYRLIRDKIKSGEILSEAESSYFYQEYEKFTRDVDWMPQVVMIAKNIYVWLDQLSRKYNREIRTMDQIPDEELDDLARWNFTALWLIGIWERSSASKKIKQMTGNPEAAASAYSLYDYVIAGEIGGENAFENLKYRAWQRGIRLASDMVPNHVGIFSKWVIEKPDYFVQSEFPPFPNYTFNGPNLSDDPRIEIRIEDKYYTHQDAAVVFQRKDNLTGHIRYIYHGNDGTSMPWNDTAQLNLLNPEVREALYQTIKHVANKTPVIRFDAAMTLTKKHYARLWFPQPGTGGAIPSRSDFSMTRSNFDFVMPKEFWREVVDRMNLEMPETLLLAEAFWLMEGYFVRTLGMHRVYNSAFMHMMMKEENNKYRELIKNTLEFNPEILKRYVNFMSNPDEDTALNQFGNGDKYFGVAVLVVTLPGLPMFGHGQIEGYKEKYGMEYKRAYYNELPDSELIRRHEKEIFPLMKKRYLFSQVQDFEFFDFFDDRGFLNENVLAFSNKHGDEKALVIYNNAYERCSGEISHSAIKINFETEGNFRSKSISEALDIKTSDKYFYTYRDHKSNLEYLISGEQISHNGLHFNLEGYQYRLLLDFKEIYDSDGTYERLNYFLNGNGVSSIQAALFELNLKPVQESFAKLLNPDFLNNIENFIDGKKEEISSGLYEKIHDVVNKINILNGTKINSDEIIKSLNTDLLSLKGINGFNNKNKSSNRKPNWQKELIKMIPENLFRTLLPLIFLENIYNHGAQISYLFDKIDTYKILNKYFSGQGLSNDESYKKIYLIKSLISNEKLHLWRNRIDIINNKEKNVIYFSDILYGKSMSVLLNIHSYKGNMYLHKESFEDLLNWLLILSMIELFKDEKQKEKEILDSIKSRFLFFNMLKENAKDSGYEIAEMKKSLLSKNGKPVKKTIKKKAEIST